MDRIGRTGEALRFDGTLPDRIRELVICVVARRTSNQFEWQMHVPLAVKAGVSQEALDTIAAGGTPRRVDGADACAIDFAMELMQHHGVGDATFAEALARFGESGTVELTALIGYFTMVCWIMNVARTPGPAGATAAALPAFPA
jgi:4-carboxymuconolactone decarboxylase